MLDVKRDLFDPPSEKIVRLVLREISHIRGVEDTNTIVPEFSYVKTDREKVIE